MRKCKRLTAFILSAAMSLQLLSMGAVSASEVNEGEGNEPPAIIQEEVGNPDEADSISADSVISVEDEVTINETESEDVNSVSDPSEISSDSETEQSSYQEDEAESTTEEIFVTDEENTESNETIVTEEVTGEDDIVKAAEDAVEITEFGKELSFSAKRDEEKWFKFVPSRTGGYAIFTTNLHEQFFSTAYIYLFDDKLNEISSPSGNSRVCTNDEDLLYLADLKAGEVYYFSIVRYGGPAEDPSDYDLKLFVSEGVSAYVSGTESKGITLNANPNLGATLSVDALGTDVTYSWYRDWFDEIDGATESSLVISGPFASDYECYVTDKYGAFTRVDFYVNMDSLIAYPAGTKDNPVRLTANQGETKTLSVEVPEEDANEIACQWYKYNPTTYANDLIAGATDLSYTTEIIEDFGPYANLRYECVLSDPYGRSCTIVFIIYPNSQVEPFYAYVSGTRVTDVTYNMTVGESKTLAVDVEGDNTAGLSYTWEQYNNETYEYKPVSGETGDSLQIASVDASQRYRCTVTGNNQARTVVFKLNVNHFSAYISGTTKHNQILYVESGESLTLSADVTADDMSAVSYEWKKDGTVIENAKENNIRLENITESCYYACGIRDGYGNSVYLYFNISVNNQNNQSNPNNLKAYVSGTEETSVSYQLGPNESVLLSVDASADDMNGITYKWRVQNYHQQTINENAGNTSSISVKDSDITERWNYYQCTVTDAFGNSVSVDFTVKAINLRKVYVKKPKEADVTIFNGDSTNVNITAQKNATYQFAVDVEADDLSGISYTWYKDSEIQHEMKGTEIITEPVTKNTEYSCLVKDQYWNIKFVNFYIKMNNLNVTVRGTAETEASYQVAYGSTADLAVDVSADDMSGLTYTWYKSENKYADCLIEGSNGKTSITTDPIKRETWYICKVIDRYGNYAEVYFRVGVENGLSAYVSGTTEITKTFFVTKGQTLTLKADATANDTDRLTYDWGRYIHNGKTLLWNSLNAFTDSYTIDSVIENETYRCRIIDKFGNCIDLIYKVYIKQFDDVKKTAYYCEAVSWALDKGITTGTSDTTFEPKNGCTRAQFVTFLWRSFGCPEPTRITQFSDVKKSAYYYKAVMWAAENGITTGYTGSKAGQFGPKDVCKREQCVTFLYRAAGSPVLTAEDHAEYGFTDVKRSGYYYDAITWAAKYGITTGISDTEFGRGQDCTRGQLVTFLQRFIYNTNYSTASFYKRDPFVDCSDGDY